MSIIEEIYRNRIGEERRLLSERELDRQINMILERERYRDDEAISNLFFEVADHGQQTGFYAGVQFIIMLLAESLL